MIIEGNSLTVQAADTTRRPRETVEADLVMIEVNSLTIATAHRPSPILCGPRNNIFGNIYIWSAL